MMPAVTVLAVIGVVLFYVGYIFPATAELFVDMGISLPPMTAATLQLSYWLEANWIMLILSILGPIGGLIYYFKTPKGNFF